VTNCGPQISPRNKSASSMEKSPCSQWSPQGWLTDTDILS
jgi:hypothetical protein